MIQVKTGKGFSAATQATIGIDYSTVFEKPSGQPNVELKVVVWDTAGQERFQSMAKAFYQKAQGVMICYDTTRKESFDHVSNWARAVKDNCVGTVPCHLIGTKVDLDDERLVSRE